MKTILVALISVVSISAFADEPYTKVRCEKYEGDSVTIVEIQREVVDIYTPQVRFVDTLKSEYRVIDPGSAVPYIGGAIDATDVTQRAITYKGRNFSLEVSYDYSSIRYTDNSGGYVTTSEGIFSVVDSKGETEKLTMSCETSEHF